MVIRSKHLCRRVLENQHKLHAVLQQHIRFCSSVRVKEAPAFEEDDNFRITQIHSPGLNLPKLVHSKDVGNMFNYSDLQVRLAAPHQLQPKPDELSFGKIFTDHMLKCLHYSRLGGWQKPEIVPMENLVLHPAAKVLHYAVELFEGMKAYRGVDQKIRLFRPELNMHRMNITAQRSGLPSFFGEEYIKCMERLIAIDQEWVPHREHASLYIRPTLIGIDPTLGVASSDSALLYTILAPVGTYFDPTKSGAISLLADPQFVRAWPGGVGDRKMGSNYGPTIQIAKIASEKGLSQVLWLYGEDHQLTEAGTMNICMVYIDENGDKVLSTPPVNGLILPGVTRQSVLDLSRMWGKFKVREELITMPQIIKLLKEERCLELFGVGTAVAVSPVDRINYLGEDYLLPTILHEKPVYKDLLNALYAIQYGQIPDHPWARVIDH